MARGTVHLLKKKNQRIKKKSFDETKKKSYGLLKKIY